MAICLWGAEGMVTVDYSPKGPHDSALQWRLCGWATNGSYVKVSVPRIAGDEEPYHGSATSEVPSEVQRIA